MKIKLHVYIIELMFLLFTIAFSANAYNNSADLFSIGSAEQTGGKFSNKAIIGEPIVIDFSTGSKDSITYDNSAGFLFVSGSSPKPPTGLCFDQSDDSGESYNDQITNKTFDLTISGFGKENAHVYLYDNDLSIIDKKGIVINGRFSININLTDEGIHSITARQMIDGNISDQSEPVIITIDTIRPDPPVLLKLAPEDDSGLKDNLTNQTQDLTIFGSGELDSYLKLRDNGNELHHSIFINETPFVFDISLYNGTHYITGQLFDKAGNTSDMSKPLTITIDTEKPIISIDQPENKVSLSNLFFIKGTTIPSVSYIVKTEIQIYAIKEEQKLYYQLDENQNVKWTTQETWIEMQNPTDWSYFLPDFYSWWPDTWYKILARSSDAAENSNLNISVFGKDIKYSTGLNSNLSSQSIVFGDELEISGRITTEDPNPYGGVKGKRGLRVNSFCALFNF